MSPGKVPRARSSVRPVLLAPHQVIRVIRVIRVSRGLIEVVLDHMNVTLMTRATITRKYNPNVTLM